LPIDVLKIDRSFVARADSEDTDAQIVKTIIALGQTLNLNIVAEGVETESQVRFLKSCGCNIAQGYLYSPPLPAKEMESWLYQHGNLGQVPRISLKNL
jgi:EAL domain-containing protein (putative c-di-GMP-specific phosphodiesterase class I)